MRSALLAVALLLCGFGAAAQTARPLAADPVLEAEVMRIAHELRCLVCQNETIAASNADLAVDLRSQIREQLRAGRSEREILDFMVAALRRLRALPPAGQADHLAALGRALRAAGGDAGDPVARAAQTPRGGGPGALVRGRARARA